MSAKITLSTLLASPSTLEHSHEEPRTPLHLIAIAEAVPEKTIRMGAHSQSPQFGLVVMALRRMPLANRTKTLSLSPTLSLSLSLSLAFCRAKTCI